MDVNEAKQHTVSAREQNTQAQLESLQVQESLEQVRAEELATEIALVRDRIDAEIMKTAQEGYDQFVYNYTVRISASRNTPEVVTEIKTRASEVMVAVADTFVAEGFSIKRGEPQDQRDIRDTLDAAPEYHTTPLLVSWAESVG